MANEDQYQQIGHLIETAPSFRSLRLSPEEQMWLARVRAVIELTDDAANKFELSLALAGMHHGPPLRNDYHTRVMQVLYNALARLNQFAPTALRGAFLPAGNAFDALVVVGKVLTEAKRTILFVDPYAGTEILETYAVQALEAVEIRILADAASVKAGLKPAVAAWIKQNDTARPVEARLAAARALHDRAIIVDDAEAWIVGQSFNHLASRSPTTITRLDAETAALKIRAYSDLWSGAVPI